MNQRKLILVRSNGQRMKGYLGRRLRIGRRLALAGEENDLLLVLLFFLVVLLFLLLLFLCTNDVSWALLADFRAVGRHARGWDGKKQLLIPLCRIAQFLISPCAPYSRRSFSTVGCRRPPSLTFLRRLIPLFSLFLLSAFQVRRVPCAALRCPARPCPALPSGAAFVVVRFQLHSSWFASRGVFSFLDAYDRISGSVCASVRLRSTRFFPLMSLPLTNLSQLFQTT